VKQEPFNTTNIQKRHEKSNKKERKKKNKNTQENKKTLHTTPEKTNTRTRTFTTTHKKKNAMLPQAKAFESLPNNKHLPTRKGSEHAETTNAEPTDAQQEQGTTTENYARAEALRRSVSPLHCFSAAGYFVSAEGEPSRPDRAKKNTNADDLFCLNLCCIFADYVIGNNIFLRRTLKEILYGKIRSQTPL
jgi:hypothetical protein